MLQNNEQPVTSATDVGFRGVYYHGPYMSKLHEKMPC